LVGFVSFTTGSQKQAQLPGVKLMGGKQLFFQRILSVSIIHDNPKALTAINQFKPPRDCRTKLNPLLDDFPVNS